MKKQHQTVQWSRRNLVLWAAAVFVMVVLGFGYGYFFGRYEQIELNKSVLKPIPDVNCVLD